MEYYSVQKKKLNNSTFGKMNGPRDFDTKLSKCQTLFFGAPKSLQMVTAADAYSLEDKLWPT